MTFTEIYKAIPDIAKKREFRKKIIDVTLIEPGTFYTWINRKRVSPLAQEKISELLGKRVEELFPLED